MRRVLTTMLAVVLLLSPLLLILMLRVRDRLRPAVREDDAALARAALKSGDAATAETRLRRHLLRDPADARGWQLLAESLRWLGRRQDAVAASRRAADLAPGWDVPAVAVASAALAEGREPDAAQALERAFTAGGATRALLRARSLLHAHRGEFDAAADDLERAAARDGGGAAELLDAARHRRTAAFVAGRDDTAVQSLLLNALRRADDQIAASIRREIAAPEATAAPPPRQVLEARRAALVGLPDLARAHLREALLARPDHPDIVFALGMRLGLRGALDRAVALADRLPRGGAGAAGRRLLGWYHVGCGDLDRAAAYLRADGCTDASQVLRGAGDVGLARSVERACRDVAEDPGLAAPRLVLGLAAAHAGDVPEALRHHTAALARDPSLAAAANELAWLLRESRETLPTARRLAAWAERLAPDDAEVLDTAAVVRALSHSTALSAPTERTDR